MDVPATVIYIYMVKSELELILDLIAAVANYIYYLSFEYVKPVVQNARIIRATKGGILKPEVIDSVKYQAYSQDEIYLGSSKASGKGLLPRWLAHEIRGMTTNQFCTPHDLC